MNVDKTLFGMNVIVWGSGFAGTMIGMGVGFIVHTIYSKKGDD